MNARLSLFAVMVAISVSLSGCFASTGGASMGTMPTMPNTPTATAAPTAQGVPSVAQAAPSRPGVYGYRACMAQVQAEADAQAAVARQKVLMANAATAITAQATPYLGGNGLVGGRLMGALAQLGGAVTVGDNRPSSRPNTFALEAANAPPSTAYLATITNFDPPAQSAPAGPRWRG